MGSFTNDSLRLRQDSRDQLKNGESEVYELINHPEKKFEKINNDMPVDYHILYYQNY